MSIGFYRSYTNAHSAVARCMLSANFLNAKAFLVLYWWFLLVSFISLCSAIHYTIILLVPQYRRHEFKSMIRVRWILKNHFCKKLKTSFQKTFSQKKNVRQEIDFFQNETIFIKKTKKKQFTKKKKRKKLFLLKKNPFLLLKKL